MTRLAGSARIALLACVLTGLTVVTTIEPAQATIAPRKSHMAFATWQGAARSDAMQLVGTPRRWKTPRPGPRPTTTAATPATTVPGAPMPSTASVQPSTNPYLAPTASIFGAASIWRENISAAPLAADSAVQVADLARQVRDNYGGRAAFNNGAYSVGYVTAPAGTPLTTVAFNNCQGKSYTPSGLYDGVKNFVGVPIPGNALAAPGSDHNLTVWSPSTDQLWEFWVATPTATGWSACWGGRLDHVSTALGYFGGGMGTTATGLSHAGGMVRVQELRAGAIDHAISLNVIDAAAFWRYSWPAQRSDGYDPNGVHPIAEGTRFRLDPSVNVDTLDLHPVARMIAKAAQKYGFIVQDKGGAVAVIGENGGGAAGGVNPWGEVLAGTPSYAVLQGFPWDRLQALPKNYGKR